MDITIIDVDRAAARNVDPVSSARPYLRTAHRDVRRVRDCQAVAIWIGDVDTIYDRAVLSADIHWPRRRLCHRLYCQRKQHEYETEYYLEREFMATSSSTRPRRTVERYSSMGRTAVIFRRRQQCAKFVEPRPANAHGSPQGFPTRIRSQPRRVILPWEALLQHSRVSESSPKAHSSSYSPRY